MAGWLSLQSAGVVGGRSRLLALPHSDSRLELWPLGLQLFRLNLFSRFLLVQSLLHSIPQVFNYVRNGCPKVRQPEGGRRETAYRMNNLKLHEGPRACVRS